MRYLIFGDVHGNLPALEGMLAFEKGNYDQLISHGDVVNYGPWSNECVALLQKENCICLKGNHEDYYIKGNYPGQNIIAKTFFEFCYPTFTALDNILKYQQFLDVPEYRIIHSINDQYFFPNTDFSTYTFDRNYIFGHSHHQFFKEVKGFKLYNTGSVGQNRKHINESCYLIYDNTTGSVALRSLKFNVDLLINEMKQKNYPQICLDYYLQKKRI